MRDCGLLSALSEHVYTCQQRPLASPRLFFIASCSIDIYNNQGAQTGFVVDNHRRAGRNTKMILYLNLSALYAAFILFSLSLAELLRCERAYNVCFTEQVPHLLNTSTPQHHLRSLSSFPSRQDYHSVQSSPLFSPPLCRPSRLRTVMRHRSWPSTEPTSTLSTCLCCFPLFYQPAYAGFYVCCLLTCFSPSVSFICSVLFSL